MKGYFDFLGNQGISTLTQVSGIGAAVNGDRTENVYSLWYSNEDGYLRLGLKGGSMNSFVRRFSESGVMELKNGGSGEET